MTTTINLQAAAELSGHALEWLGHDGACTGWFGVVLFGQQYPAIKVVLHKGRLEMQIQTFAGLRLYPHSYATQEEAHKAARIEWNMLSSSDREAAMRKSEEYIRSHGDVLRKEVMPGLIDRFSLLADVRASDLHIKAARTADGELRYNIGVELDTGGLHPVATMRYNEEGKEWELFYPCESPEGLAWRVDTSHDLRLTPVDGLQQVRLWWTAASKDARKFVMHQAAMLLDPLRGQKKEAGTMEETNSAFTAPDFPLIATSPGAVFGMAESTHNAVWFGVHLRDGTFHPVMRAILAGSGGGYVLERPAGDRAWVHNRMRVHISPRSPGLLAEASRLWGEMTMTDRVIALKEARRIADILKIEWAKPKEDKKAYPWPTEIDNYVTSGRLPSHRENAARPPMEDVKKPADKPCHEPGGYPAWMTSFLDVFKSHTDGFPMMRVVHDIIYIHKKPEQLLLVVQVDDFSTKIPVAQSDVPALIFQKVINYYGTHALAKTSAAK